VLFPHLKPANFIQHPTQTRIGQNKIFYNASTIQIHLKDNYKSYTIKINVLINSIVHFNYIFRTCYPTKLDGLCGNCCRTLECL